MPFKEQWQEVATSKAGEPVLIVLPTVEKQPRRVQPRRVQPRRVLVIVLSTAEFGQPAEESTVATAIQPRLF